MHFLDRIGRAPLRPIAIGTVLKSASKIGSSTSLAAVCTTRSRIVGMPSGRSPPPGFGIITRRTGCGPVRLRASSSRRPASHSSSTRRFDLPRRSPRPRPARPRWRSPARRHGAECLRDRSCRRAGRSGSRLRLRLTIQLPLKPPDLIRCFQAHRQSPLLLFFESTPEVRALPSTGVTRLPRYYDPVRLPPGPPPSRRRRGRDPRPRRVSPDYPDHPSYMPCPLPRWTERVHAVDCFPAHSAFPVIQAGRHPQLHFRGLLRLHSRYGPLDCSTAQGGLCHEASARPVTQTKPLVSYQINRQLSGWNLPPLVIRAVGAH